MNFFQTVFAICSGPSVFPKLISGRGPGRAFLHLLLLLLFCLILTSIGSCVLNRKTIHETCHRFYQRTGDLVITPDSCYLEKDPKQSRGYKLTQVFRFDYFASFNDFSDNYLRERRGDCGILYFPTGIVFWTKDFQESDSGMYRMISIPSDALYTVLTGGKISDDMMQKLTKDQNKLYTESDLAKTVRTALTPADDDDDDDGKADAKKKEFRIGEKLLATQAVLTTVFLSGLFFLTETLLLLLLSLLCFSLAQTFRFSGLPKKIPYKTILTATIYAAFPALIISTLYRILSIDILSYQTVFFIVFFVYQLLAFNKIFESYNPQSNRPDLSDDDF